MLLQRIQNIIREPMQGEDDLHQRVCWLLAGYESIEEKQHYIVLVAMGIEYRDLSGWY